MIVQSTIEAYCLMFKKMKRSFVKGCHAPHKVVLLLSVQYLIENGWITENRVYLDRALVDVFEQHWRLYVDNGTKCLSVQVGDELLLTPQRIYPFSCTINNPFYFMSNEPFWRLVKSAEWKEMKAYSWTSLRKCYQYAEIDQELFELMQDNQAAAQLKKCLLEML